MQEQGKQGVRQAGHCKAAAQRIYRDTEIIARRLAKGQTCREVALDYPEVHYSIFHKHAQLAIGFARWDAIRHLRVTGSQAPGAAKPSTGPECQFCGVAITPDTLKCPNCGALLWG